MNFVCCMRYVEKMDDRRPLFKSVSVSFFVLIILNAIVNDTWKGVFAENHLHRTRRQTSIDRYTIELLLVCDNAVYSWFQNLTSPDDKTEVMSSIQKYYAHVFKAMDLRYQGISGPDINFRVNLSLVDLIIAENISISGWTEDYKIPPYKESFRWMVPASEALDAFLLWVNTTNLPPHDHAILFTGYNITYGGSSAYMGLSFPDSVCSSNAVSIVEESYDTKTATVATQELGRSLGSRQDMDGNFCLSSRLNIMTGKFVFRGRNVPNLWTFSKCSIGYFRTFLSRLESSDANCLTQNSIGQSEITLFLNNTENDDMYDADEQCQTSIGRESFMCRSQTGGNYSSICQLMHCYSNQTATCTSIIPLDGTVCGNFKVCSGGLCAPSTSGVAVRDECPFGDQPFQFPEDECENRVAMVPSDCYSSSVNAECCESCRDIVTYIDGCLYGDRISGCNKSQCVDPEIKEQCCLTCSNGTSLFGRGTTSPPETDDDVIIVSITSGTSTEDTYNTSENNDIQTASTAAGINGSAQKLTPTASTYPSNTLDVTTNGNISGALPKPTNGTSPVGSKFTMLPDSGTKPSKSTPLQTVSSVNYKSSTVNSATGVRTGTSVSPDNGDVMPGVTLSSPQGFSNGKTAYILTTSPMDHSSRSNSILTPGSASSYSSASQNTRTTKQSSSSSDILFTSKSSSVNNRKTSPIRSTNLVTYFSKSKTSPSSTFDLTMTSSSDPQKTSVHAVAHKTTHSQICGCRKTTNYPNTSPESGRPVVTSPSYTPNTPGIIRQSTSSGAMSQKTGIQSVLTSPYGNDVTGKTMTPLIGSTDDNSRDVDDDISVEMGDDIEDMSRDWQRRLKQMQKQQNYVKREHRKTPRIDSHQITRTRVYGPSLPRSSKMRKNSDYSRVQNDVIDFTSSEEKGG